MKLSRPHRRWFTIRFICKTCDFKYFFLSLIESTVSQQHSIVLSCIFIMYFLSLFHFPDQKFISICTRRLTLAPGGGGEACRVHPSLAGQRKWAPLLYDPHPLAFTQSCWRAVGGERPSRAPISCLLFYEDI